MQGRRKVSSSNYYDDNNDVVQLSDELLVKVASFLQKMFRVLFATVMRAFDHCSTEQR